MTEEKDFTNSVIKLFYKQGKDLAILMQSLGILEPNEDIESFAKGFVSGKFSLNEVKND